MKVLRNFGRRIEICFLKIGIFLENADFLEDKRKCRDMSCPAHLRTSLVQGIQEPLHATADKRILIA